VLVLGGEHVVREGSWCDGLDVEPCFFQHLSRSALFDGLAKLQMPSGRSPSASTVRADAFAEQNETVVQGDDTDPYTWGTLFHL
jgi:hypothetical protein